MTAAIVRDPVSGEQVSCDALIEYSVTELWEHRMVPSEDQDFNIDDLLLDDDNDRELKAVTLSQQWKRSELNNELKFLRTCGDGKQAEPEEDVPFQRGQAAQTYVSRFKKKPKLSEKASTKGFVLKMDHELGKTDKLRKRALGLLNRITPEKYETLRERMLSIIEEFCDNEERFQIVLDSILNKASTDIEFASQYAKLCKFLSSQLPKYMHTFEWLADESSDEIDKLFKKMMVLSCQGRFATQREQISAPYPPDMDADSRSDVESKRKKKFYGTMIIIGELFNKKLIGSAIVNKGIIKSMLPPKNKKPSAVEIEALCKLLKTCGKHMDKDEKAHGILVKFIKCMKKIAKPMGFRVVVLVDEIEEMSENGWKTRFKKEKAKKLEKIHEDFEKLQIKQQKVNNYQRRDNYRDQQQQKPQRSQNGTPRKQYKKKSKPKENSHEMSMSPDRPRNNSNDSKKKNKKKKNSNSNGSKFGGGSGGQSGGSKFGKSKFGKSNSSFGSHLL